MVRSYHQQARAKTNKLERTRRLQRLFQEETGRGRVRNVYDNVRNVYDNVRNVYDNIGARWQRVTQAESKGKCWAGGRIGPGVCVPMWPVRAGQGASLSRLSLSKLSRMAPTARRSEQKQPPCSQACGTSLPLRSARLASPLSRARPPDTNLGCADAVLPLA
eukprot:762559-Pleurochrysis_carterae.AAC.1